MAFHFSFGFARVRKFPGFFCIIDIMKRFFTILLTGLFGTFLSTIHVSGADVAKFPEGDSIGPDPGVHVLKIFNLVSCADYFVPDDTSGIGDFGFVRSADWILVRGNDRKSHELESFADIAIFATVKAYKRSKRAKTPKGKPTIRFLWC